MNNSLEKYIYQNKFSIPNSLCKDIIELYEVQTSKYDGQTVSGIFKTIKNTTEFVIPYNSPEISPWFKIEKFLYKELYKNLMNYIDIINNSENYKPENNNNHNVFCLKGKSFQMDGFQIQKYEKNKGIYIYHDDFFPEYDKKRYRVITFLWYLNTIEDGGETEFWGNVKVKPEEGKLILFPSFWCFPHRGNVPISDDKYVIAGWFLVDY